MTEHMADGRTRVAFDSGDEHRYRPSSLHKLIRGGQAVGGGGGGGAADERTTQLSVASWTSLPGALARRRSRANTLNDGPGAPLFPELSNSLSSGKASLSGGGSDRADRARIVPTSGGSGRLGRLGAGGRSQGSFILQLPQFVGKGGGSPRMLQPRRGRMRIVAPEAVSGRRQVGNGTGAPEAACGAVWLTAGRWPRWLSAPRSPHIAVPCRWCSPTQAQDEERGGDRGRRQAAIGAAARGAREDRACERRAHAAAPQEPCRVVVRRWLWPGGSARIGIGRWRWRWWWRWRRWRR